MMQTNRRAYKRAMRGRKDPPKYAFGPYNTSKRIKHLRDLRRHFAKRLAMA